MENKHIVAIDAGSSKISLAVGFESDSGFRIVFHRSLPSAGIHQGRIQNAQQAAEVIQELIGGVKEELGLVVNQAVINLPSYPIVQREAKSTLKRDEEVMVQENENDLLEEQACREALDKEEEKGEKVGMSVYCCVGQSYSDGIDFPIGKDDIIGRFADHIEGYYQIFLGNSRPVINIDNTLGLQELVAARKFFMPECLAKMVLDPTDIENGVALVDIGGGVTSVSIFTGGVLRYYDSIPFGGRSVTMDIRNECGVSESLAENIKKAYGICCPDKLLSMSDKFLRIKLRDSTRTKEVGVKYLSEVVTARMREIFDAVLYIIQQSQLADELGSGIVLTGGGAMLTNCGKLLGEMSGYNVRVGRIGKRFASLTKDSQQPGSAGCLGLLYAGRGLDKVWFVTDPEDPRFNAIEEAEKPAAEEADTKEAENETAGGSVTEEKEEEETKAVASENTQKSENFDLFGKNPPTPLKPKSKPKMPKKENGFMEKLGKRINSAFTNMMDSDNEGESGDLFGDDAFNN
ncbi:MAG: rod shape-determining protein [Bacteroidales bacterium]|nr:rod shape-determining protein [Bacteroidales bacterium]